MAEPAPFPWLFPYREDETSTRLGRPVLRPFVPVSFATDDVGLPLFDGLIDTGCDAILASELIADALDLYLTDNEGETTHAVGGTIAVARYKTVTIRLHPPSGDVASFVAWTGAVGFLSAGRWRNHSLVLLGNVGFLDRWTVTASRHSQAVAVERQEAFDERFGVVLA